MRCSAEERLGFAGKSRGILRHRSGVASLPALAAFAMQPVDRPFRFTRDFCVVWALLVVPTFFLTRQHDFGTWYSNIAVLIVAPLFATFVLYGPVLFVRQVIRSGSRGWFVARVFLSIVLAAALLLGGLRLSGS